MCDMKLNHS